MSPAPGTGEILCCSLPKGSWPGFRNRGREEMQAGQQAVFGDLTFWGLQQKMGKCRKPRAGSGLSREDTQPLRDEEGAVSQVVLCLWKKLILKERTPHHLTAPAAAAAQGARGSLPSRLSGTSSPPDLCWKVSLSQMTSANPANVNGCNIFKESL